MAKISKVEQDHRVWGNAGLNYRAPALVSCSHDLCKESNTIKIFKVSFSHAPPVWQECLAWLMWFQVCGEEAPRPACLMKSSSPTAEAAPVHRAPCTVQRAARGARPWWRWNGQACGVINARARSVSICKWNKVRCPSLRPMRTMNASGAAWMGARIGPVVRGKKFIRDLRPRPEERKKERAGLVERQQIKTLPLAPGCAEVPASRADLSHRGLRSSGHTVGSFASRRQKKGLSWRLSADGGIMNGRMRCQQRVSKVQGQRAQGECGIQMLLRYLVYVLQMKRGQGRSPWRGPGVCVNRKWWSPWLPFEGGSHAWHRPLV